MAYSFNPQGIDPRYGSSGGGLPPGKYSGVIVSTAEKQSDKNAANGYLEFTITPTSGPQQGQTQLDILNVHNSSPTAVEIAQRKLSAYCLVLGKPQGFGHSDELCRIPFCFEVGYQKGQGPDFPDTDANKHRVEIKAIADINGRTPEEIMKGGGAAAAAPAAPVTPPPAGVGPAGGAPPAGGGGWGQGGQAAPAQPAAAPATAPTGGGWGAPAQAQEAAPQPQGAAPSGWGQGGQAAPAAPGWGAPRT